MSYTKAQAVDAIFDGRVTEPEQGYEINQFCEGLQPTDKEQDWDKGATTYYFKDGSAIKVQGAAYEVVA